MGLDGPRKVETSADGCRNFRFDLKLDHAELPSDVASRKLCKPTFTESASDMATDEKGRNATTYCLVKIAQKNASIRKPNFEALFQREFVRLGTFVLNERETVCPIPAAGRCGKRFAHLRSRAACLRTFQRSWHRRHRVRCSIEPHTRFPGFRTRCPG